MQQTPANKRILIACFILCLVIVGYFVMTRSKKETVEQVVLPEQTTNTQPDTTPADITEATNPEPKPAVDTPAQTPDPKPVVIPLPEGTDQFTVSLTATPEDIANSLLEQAYITDASAFTKAIGTSVIISPGAYKISHEMTPAQLLQVLHGKPYMKWVRIPPGLRKEEIANLLAINLGWTATQKSDWITKDTATKTDYLEGVYAPNTYLIPVAEKPADVAKRLIAKFNENFAEYLPQFTAKNIKWTKALTFASVVQREAANVADMPLIAGILWNRLDTNMQLGVDATLQYIRGDKGAGWWAPISVADKKIDSPYNTYKYTGLPPHPIANPSLAAIEAVLNPAETDCLYYLHDKNRVTHCAVTYEEHQKNIDLYLKSMPVQ